MLIETLNDLPSIDKPCALTIGSFDGVHLGHKHLLQSLKGDFNVALTFTTHPSSLFSPRSPTPFIIPIAQRLHLLKQCGIDLIIAIPFTEQLASTPYDTFLTHLHSHLNFHTLVLGKGATLGKERKGDETHTTALGKQLGFETHYLTKKSSDHHLISSNAIRKLIQEGSLTQAAILLGRPYTLWAEHTNGRCHLPGLCLPPPGTYGVEVLERASQQKTSCQATLDKETIQLFPVPKTSHLEINFTP